MLAGLLTDESRARAHLEDALALARSPEGRRRARCSSRQRFGSKENSRGWRSIG